MLLLKIVSQRPSTFQIGARNRYMPAMGGLSEDIAIESADRTEDSRRRNSE
jgi:hypothetical protein